MAVDQSICSVSECEKVAKQRGMCYGHYSRQRRYGDPLKLSVRKGRTASQRFAEYQTAAADGCIVWTGGKLTGGYGSFRVNGKSWPAHKWAWMNAHGSVPAGNVVRHKCDNPPCVNLDHLELGSSADNSTDMVERGRSLTGSTNPHARLNEAQVLRIRARYASGESRLALARDFDVSKPSIDQIVTRKSWKHI